MILKLVVIAFMTSSFARANVENTTVSSAIAQIKANVVFMRHALAPGFGDPEQFRINDCKTQRNLDEAGRRQAEALGVYLREQKIIFTEILSSRWCRCKQTTALLKLGEWAEFDGLNSFFSGHVNRQETLQILETKLARLSGDDLVLMVTHQVVISAITGISPPSGGLVVFNTNTRTAATVTVPRR